MITVYSLLYKPFHNEKHMEISYFSSFEQAEAAAAQMIQQFQYWGGGAVPVSTEATRWTAAGKYKDTPKYIEYPASLYIDYARENGNKCEYLQEQERSKAMINNYSYTPHILDEDNTLLYFENDDMYIEVEKEREYSRYIYRVYACSYDGCLEYSEVFTEQEDAKAAYQYIMDTYSTTPPDGDITEEVQAAIYKKGEMIA